MPSSLQSKDDSKNLISLTSSSNLQCCHRESFSLNSLTFQLSCNEPGFVGDIALWRALWEGSLWLLKRIVFVSCSYYREGCQRKPTLFHLPIPRSQKIHPSSPLRCNYLDQGGPLTWGYLPKATELWLVKKMIQPLRFLLQEVSTGKRGAIGIWNGSQRRRLWGRKEREAGDRHHGHVQAKGMKEPGAETWEQSRPSDSSSN